MIRINLLAPDRTKAKPKAMGSIGGGPAAPPGAIQSVLLIAFFVGGAAVLCAGAWWLKSSELAALDQRIADDRQRLAQLQAIQKQVDEFQKKKAILENKVQVIERLRLAQKSPVHMLDEISRALPDYVWLTNMDENRGSVRFQGESNSLAAVADFMAALQRTGWFPVVDLGTSAAKGAVVQFDLTGTFLDPEVAAREKAAQAAAQAAAPGPASPRPPGAR
jgi:type IV pilus assembly protein PilN